MSPSTSPGVASLPPALPPLAASRELEIRFTGSGSEYFRIWVVNLLLTLVTLTVYYPWAKVRRLRYFYANTVVDGQPLSFHADPRKVLRGYLLVAVMLGLYSLAGRISPTGGLIAFLIIAAVWPALLKSTMQFRLANTSWRGLRFRFSGNLGGAYKAMLPLFIPGLLFLAPLLAVADRSHPPLWYAGVTIAAGFAMLLFMPLLWWNLKKYQHDHFRFGALQTALQTGPGSFYRLFLKTFGLALLAIVAAVAASAMVLALGAPGFFGGVSSRRGLGVAMMMGILAPLLVLLGVQVVLRPYFSARMQNLLWSRTGNRSMYFNSALRFVPLLGLTLKNWLFVVLTLGLYWPFAAVATARMKLEAMTITTEVDPQTLADRGRAAEGDAAGDAAGDLFGLDIGF